MSVIATPLVAHDAMESYGRSASGFDQAGHTCWRRVVESRLTVGSTQVDGSTFPHARSARHQIGSTPIASRLAGCLVMLADVVHDRCPGRRSGSAAVEPSRLHDSGVAKVRILRTCRGGSVSVPPPGAGRAVVFPAASAA